MEKKEYLIEITYHESGDKEVTTLKTDDLKDVEMIQQGIKNHENDNS